MTLKQIQDKNPYWSSYTCFVEWVRGKKIKKERLRKLFLENVERGDYLKSELNDILLFLEGCTSPK